MAAPHFRVWTYQEPAIVLGSAQRSLQGTLDARLQGRARVLVRSSGGGAVLCGPWLLGVSVVVPNGHPWSGPGLLESYRHLGQLHAGALAELGVRAQPLPPSQIPATQATLSGQGLPALDWACFGTLSPWELVDGQGRKLVGLAQRRRQTGVLLVAGTLLTAPDWPCLCAAMARPQDAALLQRRTVACDELAGRRLAPGAVAEVLTQALQQALA